jgi:hypothetical protein
MNTDIEADFAMANRAFERFTLPERLRALEVFTTLHYSSLVDRFFEAVVVVIRESAAAALQKKI